MAKTIYATVSLTFEASDEQDVASLEKEIRDRIYNLEFSDSELILLPEVEVEEEG